ncbi:hypothetical protein KAU43_03610 [candidate division WOR-3 bacterium]|nr:hypothetical protein [candidate division WOR-3 bacterium]
MGLNYEFESEIRIGDKREIHKQDTINILNGMIELGNFAKSIKENISDDDEYELIMPILTLVADDSVHPTINISLRNIHKDIESKQLTLWFSKDEWRKFFTFINTMDKIEEINMGG